MMLTKRKNVRYKEKWHDEIGKRKIVFGCTNFNRGEDCSRGEYIRKFDPETEA